MGWRRGGKKSQNPLSLSLSLTHTHTHTHKRLDWRALISSAQNRRGRGPLFLHAGASVEEEGDLPSAAKRRERKRWPSVSPHWISPLFSSLILANNEALNPLAVCITRIFGFRNCTSMVSCWLIHCIVCPPLILLSLAGDQTTNKGDVLGQRNPNTNLQTMNKLQWRQDLIKSDNLPTSLGQ